MAGELDTLFDWIAARQAAGQRVALATVVHTWSSAPRSVGSHLAIAQGGEFCGSVSGGCVEGAVIEEALAIIAGKPAQVLEFDIADQNAFDVGLSCGGKIQIYVGNLDERWRPIVARLAADHRAQRPAALIIRIDDGAVALLEENSGLDSAGILEPTELRSAAQRALRSGRSGFIEVDEACFVRVYPLPAHLYLIGAVHIAQILAPMAVQAGFETAVIDPRHAFATQERFGAIPLHTDWPDDALSRIGITVADAVVTLSHDPKLDDPALALALRSPAFYIGALGSQRTHARRIERLTELGLVDAARRIHGPVGLPLGGRAPAEIAVSILAQIIGEKYAP
jgi:xanthine dehydrogenase accessory factor